jgi:hypothetical protein
MSDTLSKARKLNSDYKRIEKSPYKSPDLPSPNEAIGIVKRNSTAVIILILIGIVITYFGLEFFEPDFIMKKKRFYDEEDEIDYKKKIKWSIIIGIFVGIFLNIIFYKIPSLKNEVFKNECSMCLG